MGAKFSNCFHLQVAIVRSKERPLAGQCAPFVRASQHWAALRTASGVTAWQSKQGACRKCCQACQAESASLSSLSCGCRSQRRWIRPSAARQRQLDSTWPMPISGLSTAQVSYLHHASAFTWARRGNFQGSSAFMIRPAQSTSCHWHIRLAVIHCCPPSSGAHC